MSESTGVVELEQLVLLLGSRLFKSEMGSVALAFEINFFNFSRITFIGPCAQIPK